MHLGYQLAKDRLPGKLALAAITGFTRMDYLNWTGCRMDLLRSKPDIYRLGYGWPLLFHLGLLEVNIEERGGE